MDLYPNINATLIDMNPALDNSRLTP